MGFCEVCVQTRAVQALIPPPCSSRILAAVARVGVDMGKCMAAGVCTNIPTSLFTCRGL